MFLQFLQMRKITRGDGIEVFDATSKCNIENTSHDLQIIISSLLEEDFAPP